MLKKIEEKQGYIVEQAGMEFFILAESKEIAVKIFKFGMGRIYGNYLLRPISVREMSSFIYEIDEEHSNEE